MGSSAPNGNSAGGLPRRGRFQFSLRHLLALPVLVALFIGMPVAVDTWFPRPVAANVLMLDGSTRFLRNDTSPQLLQAMATTSGGETIETDDGRR